MKAIVCTEYGPADGLQLREVEKPTPKDNEVLMGIHATTVTSGDVILRSLSFPLRLVFRFAFGLGKNKILGHELAGEIEAVGKAVEVFEKGDQVFANAGRGGGAYAEYICLPEDGLLAIKPANMTYEEAAAVPVGGLTALFLMRKANIQSGQRVLIYGASGSVGTYAVQLAEYFGAEVTGVDGTMKLDMLRSIGADHVIDYTKQDFTKGGQRYDLILDVVARRSIFAYRRALNPDGVCLFVGGSTATVFQALLLGPLISRTGSQKMGIVMWKPNEREDLALLAELFEAGKVVPVIDRRYPLSEVPEALRYLQDEPHLGKIVITMRVGVTSARTTSRLFS